MCQFVFVLYLNVLLCRLRDVGWSLGQWRRKLSGLSSCRARAVKRHDRFSPGRRQEIGPRHEPGFSEHCAGIADKWSPRRIPEPRCGRVGRFLGQARQRGVISTSADASGYRASQLRCSTARGSWSRCSVRVFQGYPSPPAPPGLEAITAQLYTSAVGTSTALHIIFSSR